VLKFKNDKTGRTLTEVLHSHKHTELKFHATLLKFIASQCCTFLMIVQRSGSGTGWVPVSGSREVAWHVRGRPSSCRGVLFFVHDIPVYLSPATNYYLCSLFTDYHHAINI